jgi:branched-chain amino acid transport system substrate-binding protein
MTTMTRRRASALLALAPAMAALPAHAADVPPYRIGALLGLTDKGNWNAVVMQRGIQMAVEEINASGGIDGIKLEAAIEDHAGVPRAGVDALQRLRARYDIQAVLTSYSTVGLAIAPICEQQKIFMLDGGSVSDNLVGKFNYLFHNRSPASVAARAALTIAKQMNLKKMAQLAYSTDDGQSLERAAEADWAAYGGQVVAVETTVATASNIDTQMAKLRNSGADFLALWEFSPGPGLALKRAREFGFKAPILGVEFTAEIAKIAGAHAEGYLYAADYFDPNAQDEWPRRFAAAYRAKFGDDPEIYAANYYEGIYIVADAIRLARKAGSGDGFTGEQLRAALRANPTMPSVYGGNITFRADGVGLKRIGVLEVKDGKPVFQRYAELGN